MVKVLFFGTPETAVPYLDWLTEYTSVVGVVCRPDEPAGRGYALKEPPTKIFAKQKGLPVFQPHGSWTDETFQTFKSLNADIGIVVAYGRIMPAPVFTSPRLGCVNIHFSLLPRYRGAAPVQWSLMNGETKTGVTFFWIEEGLDSGPIFYQSSCSIEPGEDAVSLRVKLIALGIDALKKVIGRVCENKIIRDPQKGEPSFAPPLKKGDGRLHWEKPAGPLVNLIRGVCEWPGAVTRYQPKGGDSKQLKVYKARVKPGCAEGKPGEILDASKEGITVQTGEGGILLIQVQTEGKKRMNAWDFWQGARLKVGDKLD